MFGSHLSIAGGLERALLEAETLGLESVQLFTRNQQQWQIPPLEEPAVATFRQHAARLGFKKIVAHDSYLINLASGDEGLRTKSQRAFAAELTRCERLGIFALVTHGGAHGGAGETPGIATLVDSLNAALMDVPPGCLACLETTAGQGTSLNYRFEHLRDVLAAVRDHTRLAICMDTAHIFAAGYDLTTADATRGVMDEFDRVVGIQHLAALHLNDSLKPLGSRVDRHAHIGRGTIGLDAFAVLVQDPRLAQVPKILETPKGTNSDGTPWDAINLQILRHLAAGVAPKARMIQKLLRTEMEPRPTSKTVQAKTGTGGKAKSARAANISRPSNRRVATA